jgi:hypothetical protein
MSGKIVNVRNNDTDYKGHGNRGAGAAPGGGRTQRRSKAAGLIGEQAKLRRIILRGMPSGGIQAQPDGFSFPT